MVSFTNIVLVFPALMTVAAVYDILTLTIPNRLSLLLFALFFVAAWVVGLSWSDIGLHVAIGLGVFAATFALFALNILGGGDAKIAAVAALWYGSDQSLAFFIYTALFGGALSLVILSFRQLPLPVKVLEIEWIARLHKKDGGIPYGVALAAGAVVVFPSTAWFAALARI